MSLFTYIAQKFQSNMQYGSYEQVVEQLREADMMLEEVCDACYTLQKLVHNNCNKLKSTKEELHTAYDRIDSLLNVIDEMGTLLDDTIVEKDYAVNELEFISRSLDGALVDLNVYDGVIYAV